MEKIDRAELYIKKEKRTQRRYFLKYMKKVKKKFIISNCIFLCESDGPPTSNFLHHPVPVLDLRLQLAVDALGAAAGAQKVVHVLALCVDKKK